MGCWVGLWFLGTLLASAQTPGTQLTDETTEVTVYVATDGDDTIGDGSSGAPYRTVGKGMQVARAYTNPIMYSGSDPVPNTNAKNVKLVIRAGTYREPSIDSSINEDTTKTFVIEGETDAEGDPTTVLSGFDLWDDDAWTDNGDGTWSHAWTNDWGMCDISTFSTTANEVARRREMLMVDNRLIEQRDSAANLGPETFVVDETNDLIKLKTTANPNTATVMVGARKKLLTLNRASNLVIRNLAFEGSNDFVWDGGNYSSALAVGNYSGSSSLVWVENVRIQNCRFRWNGGTGLAVGANAKFVTVEDCDFEDNGACGITVGTSSYVLVQDSTISRNWWRGMWGDFDEDIAAGSKNTGAYHCLFKNLTVEANTTKGLWFDVYSKDVTVESCTVRSNWGDGVYFEIGQPGNKVKSCTIRDNGETGVSLVMTESVTIQDNTIANNSAGQIVVSLGPRDASTTDRDTGSGYTCQNPRDCTITGNTLISHDWRQDLISTSNESTYYPTFISTLVCDNNTYRRDAPADRHSFGKDDYSYIMGGASLTFAEWQALVGKGDITLDINSTCSQVTPSAAASDGLLEIESYEGTGARDVSAADNLSNDARYHAKAPLYRVTPPLLEAPHGVGSLGSRVVRGYLKPPVSGDYRFWVSGSQKVKVRLSTDSSSSNASDLCSTNGSSGSKARRWDTHADQGSGVRALVAGQKYWFELIQMTDASGGTGPSNAAPSLAWSVPVAEASRRHARDVIPRSAVEALPDGTLSSQTARREGWRSIFGSDIWQLTGNTSHPQPEYPNNWAVRHEMRVLDLPRNMSANGGSRVRAYLKPTTTGNYTFWIAARTRAELWLSTDATSANRVKIAEVTGTGTDYKEWNNSSQTAQKSSAKSLVADQTYYLEILHKADDSSSEDHCSVAWSTDPNDSNPTVIGSANLVSMSLPVASGTPDIIGMPALEQALSTSSVTWTSADSLTITYQWQRADDDSGTNAADIVGATGSGYTTTASDAGKYLRVIISASTGQGHTGTSRSSWTYIATTSTLPEAPTGVAASAGGSNTINLTWTDASSDETGFRIYRWTSGGAETLLTTVGAGTSSYSDTAAEAGVTYNYKVHSVRGNDPSLASNTASATAAAPSALQSWRSDYFSTTLDTGTAANSADPDNDGISNLMEYALNGDPDSTSDVATVLPMYDLIQISGENYLTLTFRKNLAATDITYHPECSGDLSSWGDALLYGTTPVRGMVVDYGFDSGQTDFNDNFLETKYSGMNSWDAAGIQSSGGVGGGGYLAANSDDQTALDAVGYEWSTGDTLTVWLYFKARIGTDVFGGESLKVGFAADPTGTLSSGSFLCFGIEEGTVANVGQLAVISREGTSGTVTTKSGADLPVLTEGSWYQIKADITKLTTAGQFKLVISLFDWGADGVTGGAQVGSTWTLQASGAATGLTTLWNDTDGYFGFSGKTNALYGGVRGLDQFQIFPTGTVTYRDTTAVDLTSNPHRFMRLRVTVP
jgi:parallel beta-helix repeat protein